MFYLVLPSNSSFDYHPDNTVAHFITRLPKEINLHGDWEVGLEEIQYTHNWKSFKHDSEFRFFDGVLNSSSVLRIAHLPSGYNANKGELVQGILDQLSWVSNIKKNFKITWTPTSNVVSARLQKKIPH